MAKSCSGCDPVRKVERVRPLHCWRHMSRAIEGEKRGGIWLHSSAYISGSREFLKYLVGPEGFEPDQRIMSPRCLPYQLLSCVAESHQCRWVRVTYRVQLSSGLVVRHHAIETHSL